VIAFFSPARANWALDGTPLTTDGYQSFPTIVSDGSGGAIVTWFGGFSSNDIYAQRVNASGVPQWASGGVALCAAAGDQYYPKIISDGLGGAIVTWQDYRSGSNDIYAQRVNSSGVPLWSPDGVALCTVASDQNRPAIVSDGSGGAIITWFDFRSLTNWDIYAQRVNAAGAPQWTADGVALCTAVNWQDYPTAAPDGVGGAIVTWQDYRNGPGRDVYAQRVSASGVCQWTADGVAVCLAAGDQYYPVITSDGSGGGIITWEDWRNSAIPDIYAQRISAAGVPQWTANGAPVCTAANGQASPSIVSDSAGGAIIAWTDDRSGVDDDVYAQRISPAGVPQWIADGVAVCTAMRPQNGPTIATDGIGGAIITWNDERSSVVVSTDQDIYAQRVSPSGVPQWTDDGVALCTATGSQYTPRIVSDGKGGAIVTWMDLRAGAAYRHVYAQRVEGRYGEWGWPEPAIVSANDNPDDQGGKVVVRWKASQRDTYDNPLIAYYSVWRSTDAALVSGEATAATSTRIISDPREIPADFSGSAVWEVPGVSGPQYWEWVANQDATYQSTYSMLASTRQDSVAGNPAEHYFKVLAHESTMPKTRIWESGTVSGHSVDNLAPTAPLMLTAQRVGSDVHLEWNHALAPDLRDYSVYRSSASGVTPVEANFLASAADTVLVDAGAPGSALYYIVTANDVHKNQSTPSDDASVTATGGTTGVDDTPAITALTVLPNSPNPFTGSTTLSIGLPAASDLEIDVYDVAGRRVRVEKLAQQQSGWRNIAFDGHDDAGQWLASGVYFYRVHAGGMTVTRKMILVR